MIIQMMCMCVRAVKNILTIIWLKYSVLERSHETEITIIITLYYYSKPITMRKSRIFQTPK
jgi:hypothetical protein